MKWNFRLRLNEGSSEQNENREKEQTNTWWRICVSTSRLLPAGSELNYSTHSFPLSLSLCLALFKCGIYREPVQTIRDGLSAFNLTHRFLEPGVSLTWPQPSSTLINQSSLKIWEVEPSIHNGSMNEWIWNSLPCSKVNRILESLMVRPDSRRLLHHAIRKITQRNHVVSFSCWIKVARYNMLINRL